MPISADVKELVAILNDEGFGALAGEIMTEISLGREIPPEQVDDAEEDVTRGDRARADLDPGDEMVELENGRTIQRRFADFGGGKGDPEVAREEIAEGDQLAFAADILRLRLVEPARHLAEAERLAGALQAAEGPTEVDAVGLASTRPAASGQSAAPIPISFQAPGARDPAVAARKAAPGTADEADELDRALLRVAGRG